MDCWRLPSRITALLATGALLLAGCSAGSTKDISPGAHGKNPAPPVRITVKPGSTTAPASPVTPVVVHADAGTLDSVRLAVDQGAAVEGAFSPDRTTWTSRGTLGYGKKYSVTVKGHNRNNKQATKTSSFKTVAPRTVTATSIFPNKTESSVGIGQPVTVSFDEPVTDRAAAERSLRVRATPPTVGSWFWVSDKEVRWRPRQYWKPGTTVTVQANLYGKNLGNGVYGQQDNEASFQIHDAWVAIGNVNTHRLVIYHNGKVVEDFPASFGRPVYPTHDGVHVVQEKYSLFYMNSASWGLPANSPDGYSNFPAYWATRISNGGEFVHANDGTTGSQGYANVTHGCVNLTTERSKWFYDHFNHGDIVTIVGGTPMLEESDGYGDWNVPWNKYVQGSALH